MQVEAAASAPSSCFLLPADCEVQGNLYCTILHLLKPYVTGIAHDCSEIPARTRARAAMALSKLSADEHGIILGQLCNALEPRLAVYLSSASSELRLLLTPALLQQLRADHELAAALCRKVGMRSCKELREAKQVHWNNKGVTTADLALCWARWARCCRRSRC